MSLHFGNFLNEIFIVSLNDETNQTLCDMLISILKENLDSELENDEKDSLNEYIGKEIGNLTTFINYSLKFIDTINNQLDNSFIKLNIIKFLFLCYFFSCKFDDVEIILKKIKSNEYYKNNKESLLNEIENEKDENIKENFKSIDYNNLKKEEKIISLIIHNDKSNELLNDFIPYFIENSTEISNGNKKIVGKEYENNVSPIEVYKTKNKGEFNENKNILDNTADDKILKFMNELTIRYFNL